MHMSFDELLNAWSRGTNVDNVEYRVNPTIDTIGLGEVVQHGVQLMPNVGLCIENIFWVRDTNDEFQACLLCFGETTLQRITVKQAERLWPTLPTSNQQILRSGIHAPAVPLWYIQHCKCRKNDVDKAHTPRVRDEAIAMMNQTLWSFNMALAPSNDECNNHAMIYVPQSILGRSVEQDVALGKSVAAVHDVFGSICDEMRRTPAYDASLSWKALESVRHPDDLSTLCIEHNGERISIAPYILATYNFFWLKGFARH